ncbi:MAG: hypothetical protein ACPGD5_01740 [Salibacteraceae bacterium]
MIRAIFTSLIVVSLLFSSCSSDSATSNEVSNTEEIAEEAIEDFENYRLKLNLIDSHVLEFPSPVELAANYKNTGMKFIPGITNPAQNMFKYETQTKKALNFGVYSADLSYCILNDMGQCASEYLVAMQAMSHDIGLSEILKYELVATGFSESLGNRDSLVEILNSIQSDLDATLRKNGIQDKAILFYTGAWVESAFIAFNAQKTYTNAIDSATLANITDQLKMLEGINYELSIMENKPTEVKELERRLLEFENYSASIRIVEKNDSIILNPADLIEIRATIEDIREYITVQ